MDLKKIVGISLDVAYYTGLFGLIYLSIQQTCALRKVEKRLDEAIKKNGAEVVQEV